MSENKHETFVSDVLSFEGRFMMRLIEKWGMVLSVPDGEDAAGRQRVRLATTLEVVERARMTTQLAMLAMREAGYLLRVDPPEPPPTEG